MNSRLQKLFDFFQQNANLPVEEKNALIKTVQDIDKELEITIFKLDRTEKVKRTTSILLEETIEELEQKRKAVEGQNRELEIETSLERVRTVAMSMKQPDDMLEVCRTIAQQLETLKVKEIRNVQTAIINEASASYINYEFYAKHDKTFITEVDYKTHEVQKAFAEQMLKGPNEIYRHSFNGDEVKDWYDYQKTTNVFIDDYLLTAPSLTYYWYSLGPVALGLSTYLPLTEEETNLFIRFRNVFELSYRRFIDIEIAVAQAKEARIQASLERVRAQSMSMRQSAELAGVGEVIFKELQSLGFSKLRNSEIIINNESKESILSYYYSDYGVTGIINVFYKNNPILQQWMKDMKKTDDAFAAVEIIESEMAAWIKYREEIGYLPDPKLDQAKTVFYYSYSTGLGALSISSFDAIAPDQLSILERFRNVFGLAYRRYADVAQAEAQTRQSQIETAMEKVRARALAMQKPEELIEVAQVLRKEMAVLGVEELETSSIYIHDESTGKTECWYAIKNNHETGGKLVADHMIMQLSDTWVGRQMLAFYHSKQKQVSILMQGENRKEWIDYCSQQSTILDGYYGEIIPDRTYHLNKFSNGFIGAASPGDISTESWDLLQRATAVFSLAYTRFSDLQKSEANAREAIKRSSIDRVRAETASMRTTNDLEKITPLIWNELTTLNIPFNRSGVFIMDEQQQQVHTFLSTPDGKAIAAFHLPYTATLEIPQIVDHWRRKEIYKLHWDEAAFIEWTKSLVNQGALEAGEKYLTENRPTNLYLYFLPFLQGMLYVGNSNPLGDEAIAIVQTLADAFSTAYSRYEDFNKLESAKAQIERTLAHLKNTQAQLVQSEKMASLGELTAGIAHEIQNPLNFVNNFSEVNTELIDEMKEEIEKGNLEDAKSIAEDIRENEQKINHHGRRADAIVKGMLQHSRASNAIKEPADINKIADEYLRLAYHGLRTKEKSFNATLRTNYDESIENINIIPQDIGRVLLNLYNNAFYAVSEKKKQRPENFEPEVAVSTKKVGNTVEIKVRDNGNGIPQKSFDKIFQPFFTTKPTGQGTGLGLSLSYDTIKAHGGELRVESEEGAYAEFSIQLPAGPILKKTTPAFFLFNMQ